MNLLRNISAHHARLWNKVITVKPITKYKENSPLFATCLCNPGKPFASLTILTYLLATIGANTRSSTLLRVLDEFPAHIPGITPAMMGMPEDWKHAPVWQR